MSSNGFSHFANHFFLMSQDHKFLPLSTLGLASNKIKQHSRSVTVTHHTLVINVTYAVFASKIFGRHKVAAFLCPLLSIESPSLGPTVSKEIMPSWIPGLSLPWTYPQILGWTWQRCWSRAGFFFFFFFKPTKMAISWDSISQHYLAMFLDFKNIMFKNVHTILRVAFCLPHRFGDFSMLIHNSWWF